MDITQHEDKIACSLEEQIRHFFFILGRKRSGNKCCYGNIITTITMCSSRSTSAL